MAKHTVDWNVATPEELDRSLRAWKIRLGIAAVNYAIVIAVAFLVGAPAIGLVTLIVGLIGLPIVWRRIRAQHAALRAEASSNAGHGPGVEKNSARAHTSAGMTSPASRSS